MKNSFDQHHLSRSEIGVLHELERLLRAGHADIADLLAESWLRRACGVCEARRRAWSLLRLAAVSNALTAQLLDDPLNLATEGDNDNV